MEILNNKTGEQSENEALPNKIENFNEDDEYMFGRKKIESKVSTKHFTDELYIEGMIVEDEMLDSELIDESISAPMSQPELQDNVDNVICDIQSGEETADIELVEQTVDTEDIELVEQTEDTENIELVEQAEDTENIELVEHAEDTEDIELVEQTEDTEDIELVEQTEDLLDVKKKVEACDIAQERKVATQEDTEPEVLYVVDGEDDSDDDIEAAKLAKLPLLLDYMLAKNLSRNIKMKLATMLLSAYGMFKDSPENKAIVIQCLIKLMAVLQAK